MNIRSGLRKAITCASNNFTLLPIKRPTERAAGTQDSYIILKSVARPEYHGGARLDGWREHMPLDTFVPLGDFCCKRNFS